MKQSSKEPECKCDFSMGRWGIHEKTCAWIVNKGAANHQNTLPKKSECFHKWCRFAYPDGSLSVCRRACIQCRTIGCWQCRDLKTDEPDQTCDIGDHLSSLYPNEYNGIQLPPSYTIYQ